MEDTNAQALDCWAIIEIMGHVRLAGRVSEQTVASSAFLRIDVPDVGGRPGFSKLYGSSAIYCITPTTEDIARSVAETIRSEPLTPYDFSDELRQALADARRPRLATDTTPDD